MDISRINIRTWSMLGERRTFGAGLAELAKNMDKLFVMTGDLKSSSGLDRFASMYPERFLSIGIAEQNMIGIASGLASDGFVPFVTSFSPFITGRCYDQIRMNLGYMHHNVKLVGLAAGVGIGIQGNSHYGLDDLSIMRAIPGMTIISPADCTEVVKAIEASYNFDGPIYLRLVGEQNTPIVYKSDYDFQIGKSITLMKGEDITIFAAGSMVAQSLKVATQLIEAGISVTVINMHTVKPLDNDALDDAFMHSKLIVSIEESSVIGGLGSAIAEYSASRRNKVPHIIIGIKDFYPTAGSYQYMLKQCGLDTESIFNRIKTEWDAL